MGASSKANRFFKDVLADKGLDRGEIVWKERLSKVTGAEVERALSMPAGVYNFEKFFALVSPAAENYLEQMAQMSRELTIQRFGKTIKLYAPLYVSNFCSSSCIYCGFNKQNKSQRKRLSIEQAIEETELIAGQGFSDLLLVSSEDRKFISVDYLAELAKRLKPKFSCISVEVYQMSKAEYEQLFAAGIEGVTLYQETYNREAYSRFHPAGSKANFEGRLNTADHFGGAGMREIGIGSLLGLTDWRVEAIALAEHAYYLMKRYWQSHVSISFPRLRPAFEVQREKFEHLTSDRNLAQMIMAMRLCFADAGLVLSTRESAEIRDHMVNLGITRLSAGSKTNPGGYKGDEGSVKQFEVDDDRTPIQIAEMIKSHGMEAVWKDWDKVFTDKV